MKSGSNKFVGSIYSDKKKHSVLIIDDEVDVLNLLALHLRLKNYTVFQASTGRDGLDLAISEKPEIIILDVMLPDMDGFEICKKLKENIETANIPIIFLTAKTKTEDKVSGLTCGADDYIIKPFDFDELELRIRRSLKSLSNSRLSKIRIYAGNSLEERINVWLTEKKNLNLLFIRLLFDSSNFKDKNSLKELHEDFLSSLNLILLDRDEKDYFLGRIDDRSYLFFNLFSDLEDFCRTTIETIKKNSKQNFDLKILVYLGIENKFREAKELIDNFFHKI